MTDISRDIVIVGGGLAGMMAGLLAIGACCACEVAN